jgi:hypothetical protein
MQPCRMLSLLAVWIRGLASIQQYPYFSAAISHSSGGWARSEAFQRYPEGRTIKLDTGLRRYDVKIFPEIEPLIFGIKYWGRHLK